MNTKRSRLVFVGIMVCLAAIAYGQTLIRNLQPAGTLRGTNYVQVDQFGGGVANQRAVTLELLQHYVTNGITFNAGDVTAAGNNILSGSNRLTGPLVATGTNSFSSSNTFSGFTAFLGTNTFGTIVLDGVERTTWPEGGGTNASTIYINSAAVEGLHITNATDATVVISALDDTGTNYVLNVKSGATITNLTVDGLTASGTGTNLMDGLAITNFALVQGELTVVSNLTTLGETNFLGSSGANYIWSSGKSVGIVAFGEDLLLCDGNTINTYVNNGGLYASGLYSYSTMNSDELLITNTAAFGGAVQYSTNLYADLVPNFSTPYGLMVTNDVFTFGRPANAVANKVNWCVCLVTNSAATAKAITAPANVHTQGTLFVTNMTAVTFLNYGGLFTNAIFHPMW